MADAVTPRDWRRNRSSVTREVHHSEIKSVLPAEVSEAFDALSEAIQLLQSRDLEKEQRIGSIEARLEKANAILRGAA
jgi:hypothetical protein